MSPIWAPSAILDMIDSRLSQSAGSRDRSYPHKSHFSTTGQYTTELLVPKLTFPRPFLWEGSNFEVASGRATYVKFHEEREMNQWHYQCTYHTADTLPVEIRWQGRRVGEMTEWIIPVQPRIEPLVYFWRSATQPDVRLEYCP